MNALIALAALMGAAGIWLSAAGAHSYPNAKLDVAGTMLLLHAAAIVAGAAVTAQGLLWRPAALIACAGLIFGAVLFAADLAMRAYMGTRLFPGAAPAGGFVLLLSWLALGLSALSGR